MRFVHIDNLESGQELARPVFAPDGRILLNRGVRMETSYIQRLRHLGVPGVYVAEPGLVDIEIPDTISQRTRMEAIGNVKAVFDSVRVGKTFKLDDISRSVKTIIDEIIQNPNVLASLSDVRSYDGYTFSHSVNVCVISVMLGLKSQLNEKQLYELALGAMLHDIGKTQVPEEILLKPGRLTEEEMAVMKQHTTFGWQILRSCEEIPLSSAHVAYQHHERPTGLGYPRGLTSEQTIQYAKIVAVADAYDAMTSERVYQRGMLPYEALKLINRLRGVQFESEIVDLLETCVAAYPVGCMVRLNSREMGVVVDVNHRERNRPVIRVLYDPDGTRLNEFWELDLAKERNLSIVEIVD
ncbi:MAG: HD-GYP domain-containing protein [Firmicutes bacterium]|nr:HD-GYP domain-containing protein [Bacillota bacterium]